MNLFTKQKQTHRHRKQTYGYQREKGFGINIHLLPYIKYITNKDLLYSTGNYTEYFVTTYKVKESDKEDIYLSIYLYISESLCCTPETNTTL